MSKTSTNALIPASKSEFIRQLYARLGPAEFYRRRLEWLRANGNKTSYDRLVANLHSAGIEVSPHTFQHHFACLIEPAPIFDRAKPGGFFQASRRTQSRETCSLCGLWVNSPASSAHLVPTPCD
jgi:hypothetical protein